MYPLFRFGKEMAKALRAPPLGMFEPHISHHICWPWDLDPWIELNNGRALTLYDLGRVPFGMRNGLNRALVANGWGMAVAGSSVRYRRRVRGFQRFTMVTRLLGWDARFLYLDQSMWRQGDCTSQVLIRSACTSAQGIVAPARLAAALGHTGDSPALPDWACAWIEAEDLRPWPPDSGRFLP